MGLPQGLVTQSSACVPAQDGGCTRACPERRVCVPLPGLVGHIWGQSREEGMGGRSRGGVQPTGCSGAVGLRLTRPRPDEVHVQSLMHR